MGTMASIDISAMGQLVSAMSDADANFPYDQYALVSTLGGVDVDSSPANKLSSVIAWVEQQIPGLRRRLALAQAIEAQQPGFQNVVQIDESQISTMDPAAAQTLGAADAKKLKDSNGPIDPALIAEIAKYQNDPYFAAGLAENITPTELAQVVTEESDQRGKLAESGASQDDVNAWQKNYSDLLASLGDTLATATRNTGNLALPPDYAKQWTDAITAEVPNQGGNGKYGQAAALSLLLTHGSFGTQFLNTVASGVYNYEQAHNSNGPIWEPRSSDGQPFSAIYAPDGTVISDPLPGILTALSHNADAAQQFFNGGGTTTVTINGQQVPVNSRLKYLIEDRTWSTDLGSDDGAGLGAALQAASTFYRDNSSQGQTSATVAAQTFALIGSYTGHGKSGGVIFGIGSHQGWEMPKGMRSNIANMVASYAPDFIRTTGVEPPQNPPFNGSWVVSDPANSLFPPGGPASAWMNSDLMAKVIGTLGEDPKNMDIVNTGIAAAGRLMIDYALQNGLQDPNAPSYVIKDSQGVPPIDAATYSLSLALNAAITDGYHGDKTQQAFEKQRAEDMSKVLGIVTSVPMAVPGGEWTGWLLDQAKDLALDKIGEGPDQNAQSTYNQTSADYQTKLQELTLNALLQNGYLSPANYASVNASVPGNQYKSPFDPEYADQDPPAVSIGPNGQPYFNFGSQAYSDWVQSGSPATTWTMTHVVDPFRSNLPAYGG